MGKKTLIMPESYLNHPDTTKMLEDVMYVYGLTHNDIIYMYGNSIHTQGLTGLVNNNFNIPQGHTLYVLGLNWMLRPSEISGDGRIIQLSSGDCWYDIEAVIYDGLNTYQSYVIGKDITKSPIEGAKYICSNTLWSDATFDQWRLNGKTLAIPANIVLYIHSSIDFNTIQDFAPLKQGNSRCRVYSISANHSPNVHPDECTLIYNGDHISM